MAMFDDYYNRIAVRLDNYLTEKNDGGWAPQVRIFKDTTLPGLAQYKNCARLHKETELFCKGLCSGVNVMTFGLIGGSQLKQDLEKILSDMLVASETVILSSAAEQGPLPTVQEASSSPAIATSDPLVILTKGSTRTTPVTNTTAPKPNIGRRLFNNHGTYKPAGS